MFLRAPFSGSLFVILARHTAAPFNDRSFVVLGVETSGFSLAFATAPV
jgi:hypothetical protein